jgi:hypothetical protein
MDSNWPFKDPKNVAVFTTKRIIFEGYPILLVTHDEDDGAWQFLDGYQLENSDAAIVGLVEIAKLDPSILELADLSEGWRAWRTSANVEWVRNHQESSS